MSAQLVNVVIQGGAVGIAVLLILEMREFRKSLHSMGEKFIALTAAIVDHKARAGDDTPPHKYLGGERRKG